MGGRGVIGRKWVEGLGLQLERRSVHCYGLVSGIHREGKHAGFWFVLAPPRGLFMGQGVDVGRDAL